MKSVIQVKAVLGGLFLVSLCAAHPQCLDFRPPFQAGVDLRFCPQYSSFGCCTDDNDRALQEEYGAIRENVPSDLWRSCGGYLREFMCLKCSPYAAHLFDAEDTMVPRSFPGLCTGYCESFYSNCRDIIKYMSNNVNLLNSVSGGVDHFCGHIGLTDPDYCFPDLINNDILNRKISLVHTTSKGCLCMEEVASRLRNPVLARHAGDGSNRLFVGEVTGMIHIYFPNGTKIQEPFLDIEENVLNTNSRGDERGLLGMAFHPNYQQNQKFYLYYSAKRPFAQGNHVVTISEMRSSETNPNKADPSSERELLTVDQPYWNHNGGEILFGDDNYLYLFLGDGGSARDPENRSQNRSLLLGKVLRIDVDTQTGGRPYGIPPDNPFVGEDGVRPEIYAYGVRNIWRCGKDRGDPVTGEGKGRIVCGDVGQSAYEELDLIKKGANYGWSTFEGMLCFKPEQCYTIGEVEDPIHTYPHIMGKSVTGGHFYRGCNSPSLNGYYIYGDYEYGKLWSLIEDPVTKLWTNEELHMCKPEMCLPPLLSSYNTKILSFGEDEDGEVYMLSTSLASSAAPFGKVYRIVDPARRGNPDSCRSSRHEVYDLQRVNSTLYRHNITDTSSMRPIMSSAQPGTSDERHDTSGASHLGITALSLHVQLSVVAIGVLLLLALF